MFGFICKTSQCWSSTGDMLSGWGAMGGAAAVLYAAHKASDTFRSYRRQKQEDRRMDAAERILTMAYSFRRTLKTVRSPVSSGFETQEADAQLEPLPWYQAMTDPQKHKARTGQIILRRIIRHEDEFNKVLDVMPLGRALFGEDVEAQLQSFWQQMSRVSVSADMYRTDPGNDAELTQRFENAFWAHEDENDLVTARIEAAIAALEARLLPIIRAD